MPEIYVEDFLKNCYMQDRIASSEYIFGLLRTAIIEFNET